MAGGNNETIWFNMSVNDHDEQHDFIVEAYGDCAKQCFKINTGDSVMVSAKPKSVNGQVIFEANSIKVN